MAPRKLTGAFILVDTPHHTRIVVENTPPTTWAAYHYPALDGETLDELAQRAYNELCVVPASRVLAIDDSKPTEYAATARLEPSA